MFDHTVYVVTLKDLLFLVPFSRCLSPLQWSVNEQTFFPMSERDEAEVTIKKLRAWIEAYEKGQLKLEENSSCVVPNVKRYVATYGVVPLSSNKNILLLVSSCESLGFFQISEEFHQVKRVRGLEWIILPFSPVESASIPAVLDDGKSAGAKKNCFSSLASRDTIASSDSSLPSASVPVFDLFLNEVDTEFKSILNSFCEFVGSSSDSSSFYFCSSINLAYHPEDLLDICSSSKKTFDDDKRNSVSRVQSRSVSISTFQWNYPLLRPFKTLFRSNETKFRRDSLCDGGLLHSTTLRSKCCEPTCPTHCVSLARQEEFHTFPSDDEENFLLLNSSALPYHSAHSSRRRYTFSERSERFPTSCVDSTVLFYVPAFIRGFFGAAQACNGDSLPPPVDLRLRITSYLLTRLCYPWAGTRFHRRGLDPRKSGSCANMGVSSLWVVGRLRSSTEPQPESGSTRLDDSTNANKSGSKTEVDCITRVAVYEMIRGSIPRMWKQETNLEGTPKIVLCSDASEGASEIYSHVRLAAQLLPKMENMICVDCTAKGRGEQQVSAAYKEGVRQYQEGRSKLDCFANDTILPSVFYLNCCVGSLVLKKLKPFSFVRDYLSEKLAEVYSVEQRNERKAENVENNLWNFTKWSEKLTNSEDNDEESCFQSVFLRVNCIDCIDRTTIVQSCIVSKVLSGMVDYVAQVNMSSTPLLKAVKNTLHKDALRLVRDQGFSISILYCGTPHHLRNYPLRGFVLPHEYGSIFFTKWKRWYKQVFLDGPKQDGISLITSQYHPDSLLHSPSLVRFREILAERNRVMLNSAIYALVPFLSVPFGFLFLEHISGFIHFLLFLSWFLILLFTYGRIRDSSSTMVSIPLLLYGKRDKQVVAKRKNERKKAEMKDL